MAGPIQVKVCGLTSEADALEAARLGASFLGFILHPASPRFIPLEKAAMIARSFPTVTKVAVSVEPTVEALLAQKAAGFDAFQVHYRHDLPLSQLDAWSQAVGKDRLWLAPKLPPEAEISSEALALAGTVLFDTYQPKGGYGGSGKHSDWGKFVRLSERHPGTRWILAGGLSSTDVADAIATTRARIVDVNSGAEASPGKKDRAKLEAFFRAVQAVT